MIIVRFISIAAFLMTLLGCTTVKKTDPIGMTVTAPVGSVVHVDVKSKPVVYHVSDAAIVFSDKEILTTFTDAATGNRCSVSGDAVLSNIDYAKLKMQDMRKKTDNK